MPLGSPVPSDGSEFDVPCAMLISAVSQQPRFGDAERYREGGGWLVPDDRWSLEDGVFAAGDVVNLALVSTAIGHGRQAAEHMTDYLLSRKPKKIEPLPLISHESMRLDHYEDQPRTQRTWVPVEERFGDCSWLEVDRGSPKNR
jgi:hypothetical protein